MSLGISVIVLIYLITEGDFSCSLTTSNQVKYSTTKEGEQLKVVFVFTEKFYHLTRRNRTKTYLISSLQENTASN